MKRFITLSIASLVLTLLLSSCGGDSVNNNDGRGGITIDGKNLGMSHLSMGWTGYNKGDVGVLLGYIGATSGGFEIIEDHTDLDHEFVGMQGNVIKYDGKTDELYVITVGFHKTNIKSDVDKALSGIYPLEDYTTDERAECYSDVSVAKFNNTRYVDKDYILDNEEKMEYDEIVWGYDTDEGKCLISTLVDRWYVDSEDYHPEGKLNVTRNGNNVTIKLNIADSPFGSVKMNFSGKVDNIAIGAEWG